MWTVSEHDQAIAALADEMARDGVFRHGAGLSGDTVLLALMSKILRDNNLATTNDNVQMALGAATHFLTRFNMTPCKFAVIVLDRIMEGV